MFFFVVFTKAKPQKQKSCLGSKNGSNRLEVWELEKVLSRFVGTSRRRRRRRPQLVSVLGELHLFRVSILSSELRAQNSEEDNCLLLWPLRGPPPFHYLIISLYKYRTIIRIIRLNDLGAEDLRRVAVLGPWFLVCLKSFTQFSYIGHEPIHFNKWFYL